jgi:hypothetical protein
LDFGYHRCADQTIADLEGHGDVKLQHIAEAVG